MNRIAFALVMLITGVALHAADIINYEHVFSNAQRTKDEKAKLEQLQKKSAEEIRQQQAHAKLLLERRNAAAPGSDEYRQIDAEYKTAAAETQHIATTQQAALQETQKKLMIEILQSMEKAIETVAAEEKIAIALDNLPPYPDPRTMDLNAVRAALMARRIARPQGAPDLTEKVLAHLDRAYRAQVPTPVSRPASAGMFITLRVAPPSATQPSTRPSTQLLRLESAESSRLMRFLVPTGSTTFNVSVSTGSEGIVAQGRLIPLGGDQYRISVEYRQIGKTRGSQQSISTTLELRARRTETLGSIGSDVLVLRLDPG